MTMTKYNNPIIKGFNPDPSICRKGDDYYLVTSTFEFFPGVPIYHSKNLVDWKLINYCLTKDSQLDLEDAGCSGGIYAPTIRYHKGTFYMITTNVSGRGNIIVHTEDIYGEWSEPTVVDHHGIDPSLFFDDDGEVYFCGTDDESGGIALFEIDPMSGEILSDRVTISYGAGGRNPEAPHLYKYKGYYYLMIAEGGTEYAHRETIFRSKNPFGPYESCPDNPILSHKDTWSPIQATGHADIIEDANGNWWAVCLGIRPIPAGFLHNLGRETFLSPLQWDENGWPIVGDKGTIALEMEGDLPADLSSRQSVEFFDDFESDTLDLEWNFVRNPDRGRYDLTAKQGYLKISAGKETLSDNKPNFVGIRQKEFELSVRSRVEVDFSGDDQKAGLTAFYNKDYHYEIYVSSQSGKYYVILSKKVHDIECETDRVEIEFDGSIEFQIETGKEDYTFSYRLDKDWLTLGTAKTAGLCTEATMYMTFTGTYLGIFATDVDAYFDYFQVKEKGERDRQKKKERD